MTKPKSLRERLDADFEIASGEDEEYDYDTDTQEIYMGRVYEIALEAIVALEKIAAYEAHDPDECETYAGCLCDQRLAKRTLEG